MLSRIIFMPLSDNPTTPAAICLGGESDYVDIRLNEGYLAITAVGAPTGSCFYNGVLQGFEQGWIRPGMPTLVDARQFLHQGRAGCVRKRARAIPMIAAC